MVSLNPTNQNDATPEPEQGLGMLWYRADQWAMLRGHADDVDVIEETHEEWLRGAQGMVMDYSSKGIQIVRVEVDLEEVIEWCAKNEKPFDGAGRAEYVSRKLRGEFDA